MRKYLILILTTFLFTTFGIATLQAQESMNEGIAELVKITPVAGKGAELEKAVEEFHHWMSNKEGHFEYNWYSIETGPDTGKYIARSGDHNWADLDAEHDWDDAAEAKFGEMIAPLVAHAERIVTQDMNEVSNWPESFEGYTHFVVEDWYIKNGSYGAFMKGLKKIHAALTKGGYPGHWGFMSVVSGGHGNQVTLVSPNKGWAGMADKDPSFSKVMAAELGGQEEYEAFMSEWGMTFKVGHNHMVRHLPEASNYGN